MTWNLYNQRGELIRSWKPTKTGGRMKQRKECQACGKVWESEIIIPKGSIRMTINDFAKLVCSIEGLKVQLSIAQVLEVLKIVNKLLGGMLYRSIRNMESAK